MAVPNAGAYSLETTEKIARLGTWATIAAYVLMAGSGPLLIKIMRAITNAQRQGLSSASVFE